MNIHGILVHQMWHIFSRLVVSRKAAPHVINDLPLCVTFLMIFLGLSYLRQTRSNPFYIWSNSVPPFSETSTSRALRTTPLSFSWFTRFKISHTIVHCFSLGWKIESEVFPVMLALCSIFLNQSPYLNFVLCAGLSLSASSLYRKKLLKVLSPFSLTTVAISVNWSFVKWKTAWPL